MRPYYSDPKSGITLFLADCRAVLPSIKAHEFDMVAVDPPYDVNAADWDCDVPYDLVPDLCGISKGAVVWFGAAPTLKRDLARFNPPSQRTLIWAPKFTLSHTAANGIFFRWHPIHCWQLPKKHQGPKWDILDVSTEGRQKWKHKGTKPVKLMTQLLGFAVQKAGDKAKVFDGFAGSGTTLVAAKMLGFEAVGVEWDEESCDIAAQRLEETPVGQVQLETVNGSG